MIGAWLHPALLLAFGALPFAVLQGRARQVWQLALPLVVLFVVIGLESGTRTTLTLAGLELTPLRVDGLSLVFAYIFALILLIGNLFALQVDDAAQHVAATLYAASALGAVLAGDLVTLYVFWEVMVIASVWLIWRRRQQAAYDAGFRYLIVHALGGMLLFVGVIAYYLHTGSLAFEPIDNAGVAFYLILAAFLINAAAPPLHAWLPDAYPEATVTGTVFLSAFTTKTAVYVLARGFPGTEFLVWLGVGMTLYGVTYAFLVNDIRRLLSYHIMSQVGYMVAGVGIGSTLAISGTAAHAFTHILYKALLLMGAGAVLQMTGRSRLTELGGLYRSMPVTFLLYMVGGLSISAFPLFSGFVSKTMIIEAAAVDGRGVVFLLMMLAGVGTFMSTTLKLPYFTFLGRDAGLRPPEAPLNMRLAMGIAALLCFLIGIVPGPLYAILPYAVDYDAYTASHLLKEMQLLLFTGLGFFLFIRVLGGKEKISLDLDWFYRVPGLHGLRAARDQFSAVNQGSREAVMRILRHAEQRAQAMRVSGWPLRSWPTGSMALWTAVVLALLLVFGFGR
ncbi:monovalent cation/H+ antiporter subunit D [Spiribacter salinus M19-40]|uniref:Monovalent cation/H+ antiporter subunit D n=1 Tax=Spiribacter salinus M19-40 TaxID=1260251 RepID=R4V8X3_9GAMM|nr:Na(+)/H(+) antiporter subunit D [Spiribacter salinus]AGM41430.1 monovalent cation/H+ antiporter subunit D [Spiribacter salinus M19-40]